MKRVGLFVLMVLLSVVSTITMAQNSTVLTDSNKGLYVGGEVSTNGWGGNIRYIFNKTITLKAGLERLNLAKGLSFNESEIDFEADLLYRTGGIFMMADFNYTKNLYISAGAAMNSLNPQITGYAVSDLQYGDITIPAEDVGEFVFTLTPSMSISPYAAVGFRSFMGAKERVSFNFETGLYYMGAPNVEITATGLLAPTADPAHGQKELIENQLSQYKFYPVIKFNLAIKLF
jgi:hypothetical protein